ncbi:MFS transporter [Paenibacillus sp. JX-17]|uniref:MFS transporter n=1 Tax=Paenibacillus lacisoli TaxID=3064525 RepID=A0ABT9C9H6_9BACL|nr:MFS transporter [Paenibacillus sp. JX-17]MDO7905915.1 MFS transporter [Paenibacillus sp. JX-17]
MHEALKRVHPLAWTIIVGTIFGRMATSMSIPFLSIYLTKQMGVTASATGVIVAVSSLVGIFASFYGGYISDRIGRKKVMLISVFGWAAVFIGFASASAVWAFFILNALNGLCRALFEPTSRALLSDLTETKDKLLVFNLRYAAINIGVVAGPLLGLQLGLSNSGTPFLLSGVVYALYGAVLIIQFMKYAALFLRKQAHGETLRLSEALRTTGRDSVFMLILLGSIFSVLGYGHFSSTLTQFLALSPEVPDGATLFAYMLSLNAVVVLIVQYPLVRMASRFSPMVPLILGNACVSCSLLLFGLLTPGWSWLGAVVLFTIGEVLLFTMMDVLIDRIAQPDMKGTYFGTMGLNNLGNVLAPVLGGFLIDSFGTARPLSVFLPVAVSAALGIPFLLLAKRLLFKREHEAEAAGTVRTESPSAETLT